MASNNDLSSSENILVKVDQNNLIYIDPNSVVDKDGNVQERGLKQENLTMFVNLEADLVPRSTLVQSNSNGNTLTSIAKGNINFLKSQTGDKDFNTSWTDYFVPNSNKDLKGNNLSAEQFYDQSGQNFGIESISIIVKGATFVPRITINFIDVRGKTLFQNSKNSPYNTFFHLPWPIFYLTVKGYYGKAIRYRLHMVTFNSKFNSQTGNFEVTTTFVGASYAFMNDIPLQLAINAPYMYINDNSVVAKLNTLTNTYEKKITKSSKGYKVLESVFSEYKQKGLVPQDFPVRTIKDLGYIAQTLDKILEKTIINDKIDATVFQGIQEFEDGIRTFLQQVSAWQKQYLSSDCVLVEKKQNNGTTTTETWCYLSGTDKKNLINVTGTTGSLDYYIKTNTDNFNKIKNNINTKLKANAGKFKTKSNFSTISVSSVKSVQNYYSGTTDGNIYVSVNNLQEDIKQLSASFFEQRNKLEDEVEQLMNQIIKDPKIGFGFEPTIRNIFAVVLASAEVFVRLMKDVHIKAFDASERRVKYLKGLNNEQLGDPIYPWPQVIKKNDGIKQNVTAYPGDLDLIKKLHTDDPTLWPEIEFLEDLVDVMTHRVDSNVQNSPSVSDIHYIFETDSERKNSHMISTMDYIQFQMVPYSEKSYVSLIYEIFERGFYYTLFDSFDSNFYTNVLAPLEAENLRNSINEDPSLVDFLKNLTSFDKLFRVINDGVQNDENGNPQTVYKYDGYLFTTSPFDRFNYLIDYLPTTNYLQDGLSTPFLFEKYGQIATNYDRLQDSDKQQINNSLKNYIPDSYRKTIFPFNSPTYLSYINQTFITKDDVYTSGTFVSNPQEGFLVSSADIHGSDWVNPDYINNLFTTTIKNNNDYVNMLNTPYFHSQIFSDFQGTNSVGKYRGSAYLLLNSLPFKNLEDDITLDGIKIKRMYSLFKEVSGTHYIPYHLLLKWGSIYHRYKSYINDNVDILSGFLNTSFITQPFNGQLYFDDTTTGTTYSIVPLVNQTTGTTVSVTYNTQTNVGLLPFYHSIFHQVVNGYPHYYITSGSTNYSQYNVAGGIKHRNNQRYGVNYWSVIVDNSKYVTDGTGNYYTLLPSNGKTQDTFYTTNTNFYQEEQSDLRALWFGNSQPVLSDFSGKTFNSPKEYFRSFNSTNRTYDDIFSVDYNYRKVIDLIGTFSPDVLDQMEAMFIDFASEKSNDEIPNEVFPNLQYTKFQTLLKDLVTVDKKSDDPTDIDDLLESLIKKQQQKATDVTNVILNISNIIKLTLGNPKEIDPHTFCGMAKLESFSKYSTQPFSSADISTTTLSNILLYIGEDTTGDYLNFFSVNNIKLTEDNIKAYRPLALIYAGYINNGGLATQTSFQNYLKTDVLGNFNSKFKTYVNQLLSIISKDSFSNKKNNSNAIRFTNGHNLDQTKLELYNTLKSFNDKWSAGNSIGQRLLLEEFLFLDIANKDIGNKYYLNVDKILPLVDYRNSKVNLYQGISMLIQDGGLDMRSLPAYVNFYGTNVNNKTKVVPSKKIAKNLFGTFTEVDYEEALPKTIIQLVGQSSKRLDLNSPLFLFKDDSFYFGTTTNNPLIVLPIDNYTSNDLSRSNKVVGFEVAFGDQNQAIFKNVSLNQNIIKNTSQSLEVLYQLGRSAAGANAKNVDVDLFDVYKEQAYVCEVECMGNAMIQPTMYFYLKNIPMFKGSYWIKEVSHNIRANNIITTFSGSRIPYSALPDPKDSFVSSYRVLFDKIMTNAIATLKQNAITNTITEQPVVYNGTTYTIDNNGIIIPGETLTASTPKVGITSFGVPFNGYNNEKYIEKVDFQGTTWLRAIAVMMGGVNYPLDPKTTFSLCNNILFSDISETDYDFYVTKFQLKGITDTKIRSAITDFYNPNIEGQPIYTLNPYYQLNKNSGPIVVQGPVGVGPSIKPYGIGLSPRLMSRLGLYEGQVVYFNLR